MLFSANPTCGIERDAAHYFRGNGHWQYFPLDLSINACIALRIYEKSVLQFRTVCAIASAAQNINCHAGCRLRKADPSVLGGSEDVDQTCTCRYSCCCAFVGSSGEYLLRPLLQTFFADPHNAFAVDVQRGRRVALGPHRQGPAHLRSRENSQSSVQGSRVSTDNLDISKAAKVRGDFPYYGTL